MARLRYNNKGGTLNSSLTNVGAAIDFGTDPGFATIVAPDYVPLVLDPPSGGVPNVKFEVVYLTAFTAGQTTGTISRGNENTSGQAHSAGATWACAATILDAAQPIGSLQNGVIGSGDALISAISINTGTGALTFTPAKAEPMWVQDANGLLIPVYILSAAQTITPALPASTKYAVIGVEVDTLGNVTLVKGADTATQLNTAALIAANSPATSAGKIRIADFAVWNNAGTFNFSDHTAVAAQGTNWIDRRPWARGAFTQSSNAPGAQYTTASTNFVALDTAFFQARLECTGVPVLVHMGGNGPQPSNSRLTWLVMDVDGQVTGTTDVLGNAQEFTNNATSAMAVAGTWYEWVFPSLSVGSHLFTFKWRTTAGSAFLGAGNSEVTLMTIEEIVRQNSNNGTS